MHHNAKGIALMAYEWIFTILQLVMVTLRLYSRTFLTRSGGSDDFLILIAFIIDVVATVLGLETFLAGWAQHESTLTPSESSMEEKWVYINWIPLFLVYFFVRASVLLFVLRLLPSYKKWQQRVVGLALLMNFLVTAYTCVTFGVSCIPFKANWLAVPNFKCFSKDVLVITNQVNVALACVCDIATALIPQLLLWNVQMKSKTKRQLNVLFGLGLVTALLSIGRATTITKKALTEDTTWNMTLSYYFIALESKLSVIFACCPALRQFWTYRNRTHTFLPTQRRQYPNEDFEKMRYRINLRDMFWYRQGPMVGGRVFEAASIFGSKVPPPDASVKNPQSSSKTSNYSVLDLWETKVKKAFGKGSQHEDAHHPSAELHTSTPIEVSKGEQRHRTLRSIKSPARRWGLFSHKSKSSIDSSARGTFLLSDSGLGPNSAMTTQDEPPSPAYDRDLADELSNPGLKPTYQMRKGKPQ